MLESPTGSQQNWERQTIQKVLMEHIQEQKVSRRWGIFLKLTALGLVAYIAFSIFKLDFNTTPSILKHAHTAVIDIRGVIDAEQPSSADNLIAALEAAFDSKHVKGVILRINSPGGSPVQARQVYDKIRELQKKNESVKVYATIEDLGTSAAYLIASAAEEIHADQTSLVGSIGVIMDGFGFTDSMHKLGVERRLYTAGTNKALLDPFSPRNAEQESFIRHELNMVHQAFIDNVRTGRGDRLKETPEIFSGLLWTGEHAMRLGLIDGFKNPSTLAKEVIKAESMVDYTPGLSLLDRLAHRIGASVQNVAMQMMGIKGLR